MNDQHLSDEALEGLLARTCAGDLDARNELFDHVFERLARLAQHLLAEFPSVRRWEEAGDVLDRAMCWLLPALIKLKPTTIGAFFALAHAEVRRALLARARSYSKASWRHMHEKPPRSRRGLSPEDALCDQNDDPKDSEDWSALQEAIEHLPVLEREVAALRLYYGWPEARIAGLFEVSERTIRDRWQSAVTKLRDALRGVAMLWREKGTGLDGHGHVHRAPSPFLSLTLPMFDHDIRSARTG